MSLGSYFWSDKIALSHVRCPAGHPAGRARRPRSCTGSSTGCARSPTCPSRGWRSRRPTCPTRSPPAATARSRWSAPPRACCGRLEHRGARGRPGARDVARGAQGRRGHDDRVVPRHHRRPGRPVRVLLRAVRRRRPPRQQQRQQPERAAGDPRRDGGRHGRVRDQLPAHPAAVALPGAGRGPVRRAAHRPALGAGQRAEQGHRGHGPDPDQGPARRRAAERVLLRARVRQARRDGHACPSCSPRTRRWSGGWRQLAKISRQLSQ